MTDQAQRHYIAAKFNELGASYTYHYDGLTPPQPGDFVTVTTPRGTERSLIVDAIVEKPDFDTKPCYKE